MKKKILDWLKKFFRVGSRFAARLARLRKGRRKVRTRRERLETNRKNATDRAGMHDARAESQGPGAPSDSLRKEAQKERERAAEWEKKRDEADEKLRKMDEDERRMEEGLEPENWDDYADELDPE